MNIKNRLSKSPFVQLNEAGGEVPYAKIIQEGLGAAKRKKLTSNVWDAYTQLIYNLEGVYLDFLYPDIDQCGRYCRAYMYKLIDYFCKGKERREIFFLCFGFLEGYEQPLLGERRKKYKQKVSPQLGNGSVGKTWLEEEDKITEWLSQKLAHQIVENRGKIGLLDNLDLSYKLVDPRHYNSSHVAGKGREKKIDSEGSASAETNTVCDDLASGLTDPDRSWSKSILTNIDPVNYDFVCRSFELGEIERRFAAGSHLEIICGMSGVGKTQIALQFANSHVMAFDIVWWIRVGDESAMIGDLKSFLLAKEIDVEEEAGVGRLKRKFVDYLNQTNESWFVVYDNCNFESDRDYERFKALLPVSVKGQVLVTTQTALSFNGKEPIEIAPFDEKDACIYLQKKTGLDIDHAAKGIISAYGGHALALEYAASYIKNNRVSYSEYLEELNKKGISAMLEKKRRDIKSYEYSAFTAFQLAIERILSSVEDKELLDEIVAFIALWSSFPGNGWLAKQIKRREKESTVYRIVILDLCEPEVLNYPFRNLFSEKDEYNTVISILKDYSLIQSNGGRMSIHPLTGAFAARLTEKDHPQCVNELKDILNKQRCICIFVLPDTLYIKSFPDKVEYGIIKSIYDRGGIIKGVPTIGDYDLIKSIIDFGTKAFPRCEIVSLGADRREDNSFVAECTLEYAQNNSESAINK